MTLFLSCFLAVSLANPGIDLYSVPNNPVEIPVCISIPDWHPEGNSLVFRDGDRSDNLSIQRSQTFPESYFFILPSHIVPNSGTMELSIASQNGNATSPFQYTEQEAKHLELTEAGNPVFTYNFGLMTREGVPEDRSRSCYIHPVWGMEGEILTDDFPRDHYHHRGLWWSWPAITVAGKTSDLWTIYGMKAHFEKWLYRETGPVCALLGVQNGWYLDNQQRVAEEKVEIVTYRAGKIGRVIDIALKIKALDQAITLEGQSDQAKGYGGLYFRVPPGIHKEIRSDAGIHTRDTNLMRMPWADYSGMWNGRDRMTGSAIFVPLDHPDFPPGWTIRYYGVNGVAWPGGQSVTIQPNESLQLKYRIWIHKGDGLEGMVPEAYNVYTQTRVDFKP